MSVPDTNQALPPPEDDLIITGDLEQDDGATLPHPPAQGPSPELIEAMRSLELPSDPEAPEFSQGLIALRPLFGTRTEFNFMVCDQLALRGMAPNGMSVRLAGRWGNPAAVGADVKAWYAGLSARLSAEHARIPEPAKRVANSLIEQLWALAIESTVEPLTAQINELRSLLAHAQQETESANQNFAELQSQSDKLLAGKVAEINVLAADLESEQQAGKALRLEVSQLKTSIVDAALSHEREKRTISQAYEARLLQAHTERSQAEQRHAQDLAQADSRLQRERERYDAASKANALSVDGFRQDLREANARADQAIKQTEQERAEISALKDRLSDATLQMARAAQKAQSDAERHDAQLATIANLTAKAQGLEVALKAATERKGGRRG